MTTRMQCRCGKVVLEAEGAPILVATCHCDDCQAGGRKIEALPGAPKVLDAAAGTPYVLWRRDRVRVVSGAALLLGHKLRPESATNRVVAGCCNSAMVVTFDRGPHWVSIYRDRIAGEAPTVEMRVQTRFAPAGVTIPDDAPAYRTAPPRFVFKLLASLWPLPVRQAPSSSSIGR